MSSLEPQPDSERTPSTTADENAAVESDAGFSPKDFTDGRDAYHWKTNWDPEARRWMRVEASYLVGLLAIVPIGLGATLQRFPMNQLWGNEKILHQVALYEYAAFGGLLGGCLFSMKWLYHSIAKGSWHEDRRYWRVLTPLISSGLSFGMFSLAYSGLLPLVDEEAISRGRVVVGFSFLVGYFSDSALASLARLAEKLFGDKDRGK